MKKIYNLYKIRNAAVSIGIFDGVHLGHQKITKRLIGEADRLRTKSVVITFHPHPRGVLNTASRIPLLTSLEHRLKLIGDMGVDFFFVIRFTRSISRMSADDFIRKILVDRLNIKTLVVGRNFLFGHKREGGFKQLRENGRLFGFRVYGVSPVKMQGAYISSTRIRKAIEKGDLARAAAMLGRPVTILGTVVGGKRIGRKLGFPTANINPHHEAIPASGVYSVEVRINKKCRKGILNIGTRPTFGAGREPTIELHILNFKRDIYGKDIEIMFKRKIRNERRFLSIDALRRQIQKDIETAKK